MLVLTRKLMEKLFIGDDICVTVVRLEGGQVRLGIEAPRNISVVRAELVPERQMASHRGGSPRPARSLHAVEGGAGPVQAHGNGPIPAQGTTHVTTPNGAGRSEVRIPPGGARETDSPRRERSR